MVNESLPRYGLFDLRPFYKDPADRVRARNMLWVVLATTLGFFMTALVVLIANLLGTATLGPTFILLGLTMPIYSLITLLLMRRGQLAVASALFVGLSIAAAFLARASSTSHNALILVLPIIVAGVGLKAGGVYVTGLLVTLASAYDVFILGNVQDGISAGLQFFYNGIMLGFAALVVAVGGNSLNQMAAALSAQIMRQRQGSASITLGTMSDDEDALVARVLSILRNDLNYTFAQIFLIAEDRETARRVAQMMGFEQVQMSESVDLGGATAVAEAIRTRRYFIVSPQSSEVRRRYLLPGARSSLVIPLMDGSDVLGAMDVQTERASRWSSDEIEALSAVAQQMATSLVQSRRYRQLTQTIQDQEDVILRQRQRLRELERTERVNTLQAWQTFLRDSGVDMFGYDLKVDGALRTAEDFTPSLQAALRAGELVIERVGEQQRVSVPISLRDQVIGALSFTLPPDQILSPRQSDLLQSVVQRLGLALENRRLFEQSQSQAQREAKANEVASVLLSSTDIDTVLRMAAQQFNEALGTIQTRIALRPPSSTSTEISPESL